MLRRTLGDEKYFAWIKKYMSEYAYSSIETEDMVRSLEKFIPNPEIPFRIFFDQWIYQRGHPIYSAEVKTVKVDGNNTSVAVTIRQLQAGEGIPEVFAMPVKVQLMGPDGEVKVVTILNTQREQTVEFSDLPFHVKTAALDYDESILCEKSLVVLSENGVGVAYAGDDFENEGVFPNPVSAGNAARYEFVVENSAHVIVGLYNSLGELISPMHDGPMAPGAYSLACPTVPLSSGSYFVRAVIDGRAHVQTLQVIR
jgi:hypothetical protein